MSIIHQSNGITGEAYAFPTSYAQQRLWFLHRLELDSSAYNVPAAFRIKGPLNVGALELSFQAIVSRHEVLRTTFALIDGEPKQIVAPTAPLHVPLADIRSLPVVEREKELSRYITAEAKKSFDLEKGPLLRVSMMKIDDDQHVLIINMHHIISDGWSLPILFRELTELYEAYSKNSSPSLPELPIQYADYAIWQRDWFENGNLETQRLYWKDQLLGVPILQLPADRPRPEVQSHRGARQAIVLSPSLSDQLKSLSRQEGVTLFMTLVAGFQAFLSRYSGQEDIAVGTPIAGRTRAEIEGLIGFFVNTLVLRTDFTGQPTFREILARVRKTAVDAYDNQDFPFEKLVQEINPERSRSHTPLFQAMFSLQKASDMEWCLPGVNVSRLGTSAEVAKFDLSASMTEKENSLRVSFSYNTDLYDGATIQRWLCHLESLFEAIVEHPDRKLSELSLLSEGEKHQLLVDWNQTETDFPKDQCIHELFEAQVERTPNAVALVSDDRQLTYKELNGRANQLARYLKDAGVQRDGLVGICLERSFEMIVALLGVLKAGGAYVPLDPGYPKERLAFMLEDTQSTVLITQERFLDRLPNQNLRIACGDRDWPIVSRQSDSNLGGESSANSLAYVIYTSGSTGKPKGVAVSHRAVNRLVINTNYVQVTSADVFAQASNISFDAATFEIWGALLNGARLVLIPKDVVLSPTAMSKVIEQHGVTTLFLTTALFNLMAEQIPSALGKLQNVLFGGEAVDADKVRKLLSDTQPKRLLHVYGPTESTTFTCWYEVRNVAPEAITVPIGRPIANTEVYILDSYLNPVPIGVAGEIYIGGAGLARGYLNRPELTAEKFVRHPFSNDPGSRLYRTGDRARFLSDGNIEFLGRLDNQVKIRGYRIELGEIEAVLHQHPSVRECIVLACKDGSGETRLIAYVVAARGFALSAEKLRDFLKEKLPEFMIPSAIISIEQLPLTPNGKVDRQALPIPDFAQGPSPDRYVAPRTAVERALAEIWAQILKVERVGIHDNFFDSGGHSLIAVRLAIEMEKILGKPIPVALLFKYPTIAQLAGEPDPNYQEGASSLIAVQPNGSKPPLFCVHGYNAYVHFKRYLGDDQPFYGLGQHFTGNRVLSTRVEDLARENLKEVFALQAQGPYFLAGHSFGGLIAYEMAQLLRREGHEVAFLGLIDTVFPGKFKSMSTRVRQAVLDFYYATARLTGRAKLHYMLKTAKSVAYWSIMAARCYGYQSMDKTLPAELRTFYIDEILFRLKYPKEQGRYRPQPYAGTVHYFKAQKNLRGVEKWRAMVGEGLTIHDIPGDHLTIIDEPGVYDLAQSLKACLENATARSQRRPSELHCADDATPMLPSMAFRRATLRR